ncbi:MAG TPA: hypothetical protein VFW65_18215 [Pseudonocardiaceae bacterium]|nr:hypothetical protein [Pseudonocardiaceae bacterium]
MPNVGAYGLTASLTAFLSRSAPLEVVFDGDDLVGSWRLTTTAARQPTAVTAGRA